MFSFELTPEQVEMQEAVRDFATAELKPVATKSSRLQDPERPVPWDVLELASRMGLRALSLSEARGGAAADCLTACVVLEELGAADASIAATIGQTALLAHVLFDELMSDAQRAQWLPIFLDDHRCHLSFAGHEAGFDYGWSYHRPLEDNAGVGVTAVRHDDGSLTLDGVAPSAANAPIAKLLAVEARVSGAAGTILALVPREAGGVTVTSPARETRTFERWSHAYAGTLAFENCSVRESSVIEGPAADTVREAFFRFGEPQQAAINLGIGRAANEAALAYTRIRRQGGRFIVEHEAIGTILANIAIKLEVARNTVWKAAWAANASTGERSGAHVDTDAALPTIARIFTAEAMREATEHAAECFGAMGVMRDMPLQKYVHDALVSLHSGRNAGARLRIAEAVTGYERG